MKKKFIINGKEVSEKEFEKFCSKLKFAKDFNEAFLSKGEFGEKKEYGSARFVQATDKKRNKYEHIVTSWPEEDILEIREIK